MAAQTFRDFVWVVINDGGDPQAVRDAVQSGPVDPAHFMLLNNSASRGMEAASNLAIAESDSDLVAIHDDDDTWDPRFLAAMTSCLDRVAEGACRVGGVVCHSTLISERLRGGRIETLKSSSYNGGLSSLSAVEVAARNRFPPISFLFARSAWRALGGFEEDLETLGDWDFNFRFLLDYDIEILPRHLANYHLRRGVTDAGYANSLSGDRQRVVMQYAFARNAILRKSAQNGDAVGALIASIGHLAAEISETPARDGSGAPARRAVQTRQRAPNPADMAWLEFNELLLRLRADLAAR